MRIYSLYVFLYIQTLCYNKDILKSKNMSVKCYLNGKLSDKRKVSNLRFIFCIPLHIVNYDTYYNIYYKYLLFSCYMSEI